MFSEEALVRVAKRENNTKRSYLVLNCLQAKHIPALPGKTLEMFGALAGKVKTAYPDERILVIGFAETATAIGAHLAVDMDCMLMQTTREPIEGVEYLYFTESHSHATEQKVVKDDLDSVIGQIDRIVFAEDEVTTGNTIMKIVYLIKEGYQEHRVKFAVASLLNGMDEAALETYARQEIDVHYLVKTDHSRYSDIVQNIEMNGRYVTEYEMCPSVTETEIGGYVNGRRLTSGKAYREALEALSAQLEAKEAFVSGANYLVIGTEECMYPAIFAASCMEQAGCKVKCHSTTRSPIAVSEAQTYPLHCRYALRSMYDAERNTFIYDLDKYDRVYIITDATDDGAGKRDLLGALAESGNDDIRIVRWKAL